MQETSGRKRQNHGKMQEVVIPFIVFYNDTIVLISDFSVFISDNQIIAVYSLN